MTGSLLNLTEGEGLASVYSGGNLQISGTEIVNRGGSIAAAGDLALSGRITNTYTGELVEEELSSGIHYDDGYLPPMNWWFGRLAGPVSRYVSAGTKTTTIVYQSHLTGKAGKITSGNNLTLDGVTLNDYGSITSGGAIALTGTSFKNNSSQNKEVSDIEEVRNFWDLHCGGGGYSNG
ncbi:hypothetical protein QE250_17005, partial [Chromatiaceae bacterium AAb-1]|nr:hypothetical protein [Chromatiaceae bacterium AAb-1]